MFKFSEIKSLINNKIKICSNSVWNFNRCDDRFGFNYPGRIPGQIYANFFYFFTKKGDAILDLFAGSGTSIDIGNFMEREVVGLDLNPSRHDIIFYDVLKNINPFEKNTFDAIFCDPPYYNMNRKKYSNKKNDLANLSLFDFINALSHIKEKFRKALKKEGYFGLIISNKRENGNLIDLEYEVNKIFSKDLTLKHKIIVPYHNTRYQRKKIKERFLLDKFLLIGHRTLFVFKKELE